MEITHLISQDPLDSSSNKKDIVRPTVEYDSSVWGGYFIHLPPSFDQEFKLWMQERIEKLKEKVLGMLTDDHNPLNKMCTIDSIQRLGIAYHFEEEIRKSLNQIYEAQLESKDLHIIALRFRLLRQEGYNITTDEFNIFVDEDDNFMQTLSGDVKGMLSLYEAAYLAKRGEEILDKAIEFCTNHLKTRLNHVEPKVAIQIHHALETPFHRRVKRLEARDYISIYEALEERNDQLLELAKLDFNLLLSLHQEEIKNICVWWKELGLATKLTFARDKIVEGYFWMLGVHFEPALSRARIMSTKILAFASFLDDIYDAYGTLEELEVFTDVLQRWDAPVLEQLPECLKIYLISLVNTLKEFEEELAKDGYPDRANFLRKEINGLATAYLEEAKWRSEGYIPPFDVHLSVSLVTSAVQVLACAFFIGMGEIATSKAFNWVATFPKILKASCVIGRLMNDIVSFEREKKREHVASSIECYMKEYDTTLEDACMKLRKMIEDAWKDINQESLRPIDIPRPLLMPTINLACMCVTSYKDSDAYTVSSEVTKDHIIALIIETIPM